MPFLPWKEYQERLSTEEEIRRWYARTRTGIGLLCGRVSGHLELLEFEAQAVEAGLWNDFKAIAKKSGLMPLLKRIMQGFGERSPSGGIHLLYRCEAVTGNLELAKDADAKVLIETRGEGGYVIVAPSNGAVHPSGGAYTMLSGAFDLIATIEGDEREALLELARSFDQTPAEEWRPAKTAESEPAQDLKPGEDFSRRGDWAADVLEPAGWTFTGTHGGRDHWYRKGGGRAGWTSATLTPDREFLYVFSTSTELPTRCGLSKYRAYAFLQHGGNFSEAASALRKKGFGSQAERGGEIRGASASEAVPTTIPTLPETFWVSRPGLTDIRRAAHSRGRSADAVLGVVLSRLAAGVSHEVKIPAIVGSPAPLNLLAALIGPPGSGKGTAHSIGCELLPLDSRDVAGPLPIGSGEGLVESFFDFRLVEDPDTGKQKEAKVRSYWNAVFFADEGEVVSALAGRAGSTLLATLRTVFSGGLLGQANASKERRRVVPAGDYSIGIIVGLQPQLAGPLLDDADAGTPQRLVMLSAIDPAVADDARWPDGLDLTVGLRLFARPGHVRPGIWRFVQFPDSVVAEVRAADLARARGAAVIDTMQAHSDLLRLKLAAGLALLDGRVDVTEEDWRLATIIKTTSDQVRTYVQQQVAAVAAGREMETSTRLARREVDKEAHVQSWRTVECARKIAEKVRTNPGVARADLYRDLRRWREEFDDGLDHATREGWVHEQEEPGRGATRRALYPGRAR